MKYELLNTTDLIIQLEISWGKISGTKSFRKQDLKIFMMAIGFATE